MDDFGKEDKTIVAAAVQPVLFSEDNEREEERLAALGYKQVGRGQL